MQSISICTYSKNRIEHVKGFFSALIPLLNPIDEVVYVDYNDPQNSKDYVKSLNNPQVKVYEVPGVKHWHMNHARNCAGIQATKDILAFIDIDVFFTDEIIKVMRENTHDNQFVMAEYHSSLTYGSCSMTKEMYIKVNGYEEMFTGYGLDDLAMYEMLWKNGYAHVCLPKQTKQNTIAGPHTRESDKYTPVQNGFNNKLKNIIKESTKKFNNYQRTIGYGSSLY